MNTNTVVSPFGVVFTNIYARVPELTPAAPPKRILAADVFERWRIVTDLNGDGTDDLILSEDPGCFGNGGGPWDVYISSNGNWRCIGDVGMYPGAFAMDKVGDNVDLWYYRHMSAREGGGTATLAFESGRILPKKSPPISFAFWAEVRVESATRQTIRHSIPP